ncbi:LysR substrate-binding domain-containing protein [Variovorax sp. LT1R20]|uniref:LysR substrate-binding domain-containing protein n=1 Tax=Variovorax sp. LT1R20 TaxID=3443729 RepID=UPI003F4635CA
MKYPQILTFVSVARLGSIRAAARSIGVSQAAVTKAIKALEADLGTVLFSRGVHGVNLTRDGFNLLPRATHIVEQMRQLPDDVHSDERGRVAMGISSLVALAFLPEALPKFLELRPRAPLRIMDGFRPTVLAGLGDGTLDFGVCAVQADSLSRSFRFEPWFEAESAVMVRKGHPLTQGPCSVQAISHYPLIHNGSQGEQLDLGAEGGIASAESATLIESHSAVTTGILLKLSDAVAVIPRDLAPYLGTSSDYTFLKIKETLPRSTIGLLVRAEILLSSNAQLMVDLLERAVGRRSS